MFFRPQSAHEARDAFALEVLHDHEQLARVTSQLVHMHHVAVLNARHDARLVEKHVDETARPRQMRQDAFEHNRSLEAARTHQTAQQDFGHATGGEVPHDLIATYPLW